MLLLSCSVGESPSVIRCTVRSLKGPVSQVMAANGAESPGLLSMSSRALQQLTKQFPRLPSSLPSSHSHFRSLRVRLSFSSKDLDKCSHGTEQSEGNVLLGYLYPLSFRLSSELQACCGGCFWSELWYSVLATLSVHSWVSLCSSFSLSTAA